VGEHGADGPLEEAAQRQGATLWRTFRHVTLPMILPGVLAGAILALVYSFNDVTISIFLVARETTTLPVELMAHIEYQPDPTPAAVSSIILLLTLGFFLFIERTLGLRIFTDR
jgi:putative spermidine/putrescine transport system permease protein